MRITSETIIQAVNDIATAEVLGEVVMLHMESGKYFSLAGPGGDIWKMIQQPVSVSNIVDHLLERYEVPRDICEGEVEEILQTLVEKGLVKVV